MKSSVTVLAAASLALACSSCKTQRDLAQFGDFRLGTFGQNEFAASTSSTPSTGAGAARGTVTAGERERIIISDSQPAVAQARAQAASDTYAPMLVSTNPSMTQPQTAVYTPPQTFSPQPVSGSTLEVANDLSRTVPNEFVVKTTAYTHYEADHIEYGNKAANGEVLKYGQVRSAAADWSRYPLGTRFRIKGMPYEYVVDDYGRALVDTDTIDLYKPDNSLMDKWGARDVGIEVLEWGSFEDSKRILESRKHKADADHVRRMLRNIEEKIEKIPAELRDGFRA